MDDTYINPHYDSILNGTDNRFEKMFNIITLKHRKYREDIKQEFYYKLIKYRSSFIKLMDDQIYFYCSSILKRILTLVNKHNNSFDFEFELDDLKNINSIEYDNIIDLNIDSFELHTTILNLPFYEREILKLYYFEYKTYREISQETKIPITSLNMTVKKAIKKLRKYYGLPNE